MRWSDSVINVGVTYIGVHKSRHLMAWATDKQLQVIIMLFETVKSLRI